MSFDMPERHGRNELKDYLVPVSLRSARRLILGDTRRTLASELQRLTSVDMFNHDSWHAFSHMMWEFLIADKHLTSRRRSVLARRSRDSTKTKCVSALR